MNDEFKMMNLKSVICDLQFHKRLGIMKLAGVLALSSIIYNSLFSTAFAQQPQAPAGTPLYSVNAKYVNGMAPGYWPTAGSGLTLNVSAGTAYCGNPPAPVSYPGGSLSLAASATNYVYLDPANNCAPAAGTSAFAPGQVPIATVVTGASSITSVTDARTWFTPQPCATGAAGSVNCSSLGTNQNITLTPSGTGATVVTNLQDKGGQVFNVKAYGAKGDGLTDDSPAFQAAVNAAKAAGDGTVLIPPAHACYLLSEPINLTNAGGVTIEGSESGDAICGNTGGIVFDVTGSDSITFSHVHVTAQSGVTNPSLIGIYAARNSSGSGAQDIDAIDCSFKMPTHTSGSSYSFGAYLYGSEIDFFTRDYFTADYPLVVSATNDFSQNSAFIAIATGTQSETDDFFTQMELDTSGLGPAAYFHSTSDMRLSGHSWNFSQANPYPAGLYSYAIEIVGITSSMSVDWRQEGFPGFAHITHAIVQSVIRGTTGPGPTPPLHAVEFVDASSTLLNDKFLVRDEYSAVSPNYFYDSTEDATHGVAVMDNVDFYCGAETNCGNIPVGNYQPGGWSLYQADVHYSGDPSNMKPVFTTTGAGVLTRFPNSAATVSFGPGAPAGTCVTPSLYLRTDGGTGSTLYVCENGAWVAK